MRTQPAIIRVRTKWLYLAPGGRRTRWHPFSRWGSVVSADVQPGSPMDVYIDDYVREAVTAFGDDKDLIIEVRLATDEDKQ